MKTETMPFTEDVSHDHTGIKSEPRSGGCRAPNAESKPPVIVMLGCRPGRHRKDNQRLKERGCQAAGHLRGGVTGMPVH